MKSKFVKHLLKYIPLILLLFMAVGAFCRRYQLKNELFFDGSLAEGAFMHKVLLILTLTLITGFGLLISGLENLPSHKDCFTRLPLPLMIQATAGILIAVGNAVQLSAVPDLDSAYTAVPVVLTKYLPYLGILAGLCILIPPVLMVTGRRPSPIPYMLVSVYLVLRLIVSFQEWNMDPSVHDYAYKLLAAITTMLGCFQISGFAFDKGKRRITIFWCLCAAFFWAVSIPDFWGTNSPESLINLSFILLMMIQGMQLLYPSHPGAEAPGEPSSREADPAEEP